MRFSHLVALAFSALRQQKARTVLTLLGVIIGTFVLLLSLSIGQGVRTAIAEEWRRNDQLRRIEVHHAQRSSEQDIPASELEVKGEMSDARRDRLRQAIIRLWPGKSNPGWINLTPERLEELAALDHVEAVIPFVWFGGRARFNQKTQRVSAGSAEPNDRQLRERVIAGAFFTADQPRGVMVSEYLLYQLGIHDEADVQKVVGQKLRLELASQPFRSYSLLALLSGERGSNLNPAEEDILGKVADRLPAVVKRLDLTDGERETLTKLLKRPATRPGKSTPVSVAEEFTITGVLRMHTREELRDPFLAIRDESDVLVPATTAAELFFRLPGYREAGVNSAVVRVASEDNVEEVDRQISNMGLGSYAPIKFLEAMRLNVLMISLTTAFVAVVALVVAGLGITNTLLMSVLERTHEIGIMKAVGARDFHIQMLFLMEGAWIGLLGSSLGLLCGWLASLPGDAIARRLAQENTKTPFDHSLFAFPWWLVLGVPLFVTLLTMLAAVYPARRAARVNPMMALRHE